MSSTNHGALPSTAALSISILLSGGAAFAQAPEGEKAPAQAEAKAGAEGAGARQAPAPQEQGSPLDQFNWVQGPNDGVLGVRGRVKVPEGYRFVAAKDAQAIMKAMGNLTNGKELGLFAPNDYSWFALFEFSDVGYVKDDDKDEIDADELLEGIQEGNEAANEERRERGSAGIINIQWHTPPNYNEVTKNLEWVIQGTSEGDGHLIVNHNTRILGRKGVMEVTLMVKPEKLDSVMPNYRSILDGFGFVEGQRYAEFRDGDKIAEYGLVGLIGLGAVGIAAKAGLFAGLLKLLAKGGKLIIVGLVAIGAFLKSLFTRRKPEDDWQGPQS